MTLFRLKSAPLVLIENDVDKNVLPLLLELTEEDKNLTIISYEQPVNLWKNAFRKHTNVFCYRGFEDEFQNKKLDKQTLIVDSINQMALTMGYALCLNYLKQLQSNTNIQRLIIVLHTDCLTLNSKLQLHLNHIAKATISYDVKEPCKLSISLKKGNKVLKSVEMLSYDTKNGTLKLNPVIKEEKNVEEPVNRPSPGDLSTFKIEVDQTEKIEKYKLKLPYMSKIHEGESKVFYEPDAVDDWDEEDPDEDLDI